MARPVIALVGAGQMGTNHARIIHESPSADLGVVIDLDGTAAEGVASRHWARVSDRLDAAANADAVIIATSSESHLECALRFIEEGKPVLVEKPLAPTLESVDTLLDASARKDSPIMCGFVERFNAAFVATLALLSDTPQHVMTVRHSPPAPRIRSTVVADLLLHDLDLVQQLFGEEAALQGAACFRTEQLAPVDIADCTLSFRSGVANLSANRAGQRKVRMLTVHTPSELIEVDLLRQDVTIFRNVSQEILLRDGGVGYRSSTEIDIPFVRQLGEPLALQFDHFLTLVNGNGDPDAERERIRPAHELMSQIEAAA